MKIARVAVENAALSFDKLYDYLLPEDVNAKAGCRVTVPFGRGNLTRVALVLSVSEGESEKPIKSVISLLDKEPLLNGEGLSLLNTLCTMTFCTHFEALHALIPPGTGVNVDIALKAVQGADEGALNTISFEAKELYRLIKAQKRPVSKEKSISDAGLQNAQSCINELLQEGLIVCEQLVKKRIADERAVMARLIDTGNSMKFTEKQQAVISLLEQVGCASVRELCYFTGVGKSVVSRLAGLGVLELFEQLTPRRVSEKQEDITDSAPIVLSPCQQKAYDELYNIGKKEEYAVSLLHGITGSGKTQVFLKLIEEALSRKKTAMVLIPEISLTPQTAAKFSARFGSRVAVLHSSLSMTERLDEWQRIRSGIADIVVGTRSAVFAPLNDIGLIVIDEEQEHTYHSESSPRYHARDIAKIRARYNSAHLLLCSATPSVESYYNATEGRYNLVELPERYSGNDLPQALTVDMRTAPLAVGSASMSEELCEQIRETLERKEQAILLLNRRGYNTIVKCSSCGQTATCPNCSIPLIYHSANNRLVCHYCGYSRGEKEPCESCKSPMMRHTGVGTQRIEEELKALFSSARVLRMDMDTTMSRFSHQRSFAAFAAGDYDIMIGTQMVAKGLDFPNVTLVGVLNADQSLYSDNFRSFENTFSLITQVVGRCGRAEKPGRAVIQTFSPDNRVLNLAAEQDYKAFYRDEIAFRRAGLYPPFCDIACVVFWSQEEKVAVKSSKEYHAHFTKIASQEYPDLPIRLLGPAECTPYKVAGRYRCRLLVKCRVGKRMRELFWKLFEWCAGNKDFAAVTLDFYYNSNL